MLGGSFDAYNALVERYGVEVVRIAEQLNYARYKRKERVTNRIGKYIRAGDCFFLTLTFTDDVLSKTSVETRRKYVRRYLKSLTPCYVGNIDFGKTTEREHYHALVVCAEVVETWKYGFIGIRKLPPTDSDMEAVCRYVAKLSNHAMKENDGVAPRIIYSRPCSALK